MVRNIPFHTVFVSNCGAQRALDLIADKWAVLVIYALSDGTKRYSELQRQIEGVSQKMLTQTLRNLEQNRLVSRQVYAEVPPRVEYSLTPLGVSLLEPLRGLCQWVEEHSDELEAVTQAEES